MGRPSNIHSLFSFDNSWGALWSVWNRITRALSTRETRLRKHTHTEGMRNIYNMQLVSLYKDRSSWQGFLRVWRGKNGFYNAQRLAIRYIPNLSSSSFSKRFPFELPAAGASHSAGVWWKKRIERHVRWRLLLPTILSVPQIKGKKAAAVAAPPPPSLLSITRPKSRPKHWNSDPHVYSINKKRKRASFRHIFSSGCCCFSGLPKYGASTFYHHFNK